MIAVGMKLKPRPHLRDRDDSIAIVEQKHYELGWYITIDNNFGSWYKTEQRIWCDFETVPWVQKIFPEPESKLTPEEKKAVVHFCVRCLGSSDNSSWGAAVGPSYCMNCGAGGTIDIPRWAVESIREQASWVGKRYYPHKEDLETREEIRLLRALAPDDPRRTVKQDENNPRRFYAEQPTKTGSTGTTVVADSLEEAREKAKVALPYLPPKEE